MTETLRKSALTTAIAVSSSALMTWIACVAAETEFPGVPMVMSVVCPLLISPPISFFFFSQSAKVAQLYANLEAAHEALKAATSQLEEASRRDSLTGLLNRAAFFDRMDADCRKAGGAMLMIDADRFKEINDTFGHGCGDAALVMIARSIETLADDEALVARIGGEEFAAFLPTAGLDQAESFAGDLLGCVARRDVDGPNGPFRLTVSVGVAAAEAGVQASAIYHAADEALYEAKRTGRNRLRSRRKKLAA